MLTGSRLSRFVGHGALIGVGSQRRKTFIVHQLSKGYTPTIRWKPSLAGLLHNLSKEQGHDGSSSIHAWLGCFRNFGAWPVCWLRLHPAVAPVARWSSSAGAMVVPRRQNTFACGPGAHRGDPGRAGREFCVIPHLQSGARGQQADHRYHRPTTTWPTAP